MNIYLIYRVLNFQLKKFDCLIHRFRKSKINNNLKTKIMFKMKKFTKPIITMLTKVRTSKCICITGLYYNDLKLLNL